MPKQNEQNESQEPIIYQIREYIDSSTGRQVSSLTHVRKQDASDDEFQLVSSDGKLSGPPKKVFRGMAPVMTNQGPKQFPFVFPETFNFEDCWDKFDEVAQEAIRQMQQEQKSRIIVPGKG